jgi:zinc transport system ATP-binding protein
MATPTVIEVQDVCFAYGEQEALHNVTFALPPRAFLAVVGPNGGGKSTLLKLLLGELTPRFGRIRVLGGAPQAARRRVGYVPQALAFDAGFPVNALDVVLMGLVERRPIGPYRAAERRAAAEALARVGLAEFGRRAFADLSGGERQRVLIAQALVCAPELLLLDEPTASVDAAAASRLHALFQTLKRDCAIVMVSHNLGAVTRHATHVLCVNRTAEMQPLAAIAGGAEGELTLLTHDAHCPVLDDSDHLRTPHRGVAAEGA